MGVWPVRGQQAGLRQTGSGQLAPQAPCGVPAPPGPQMLTLCWWASLVTWMLLGWLAVGPGWPKAPALSRQT